MVNFGNKGFTRLETALGLGVVVALLVLVAPRVWRGTGQDRQAKAERDATKLAAAVLDYRQETGRWPAETGPCLDVTCLTETPAPRPRDVTAAQLGGTVAGAMVVGANDAAPRPWLDAVPVDPWGSPYRVYLLTLDETGGRPALVVISAGPDGTFQTSAGRAGHGLAGDDLGITMPADPDGGSRP